MTVENKKVLVIGSGMDVTSKKRGKFIDEYFDEVIIVKYSINFLEEFKEYLGNPTILVPPTLEWTEELFGETQEQHQRGYIDWRDEDKLAMGRKRIYDNIANSNIKEIWRFTLQENYPHLYKAFDTPNRNALNQSIKLTIIEPLRAEYAGMTTGMMVLNVAVEKYGKVYYMGFDGHRKGVHYYHHLESLYPPYKEPESDRNKDPAQYFKIRKLEDLGLLEHIDLIS